MDIKLDHGDIQQEGYPFFSNGIPWNLFPRRCANGRRHAQPDALFAVQISRLILSHLSSLPTFTCVQYSHIGFSQFGQGGEVSEITVEVSKLTFAQFRHV
jgi:hypothetical protein